MLRSFYIPAGTKKNKKNKTAFHSEIREKRPQLTDDITAELITDDVTPVIKNWPFVAWKKKKKSQNTLFLESNCGVLENGSRRGGREGKLGGSREAEVRV